VLHFLESRELAEEMASLDTTDALTGLKDDRRENKNDAYGGETKNWHLERPSTAERMIKQNDAGGFVAAQRTLHRHLRAWSCDLLDPLILRRLQCTTWISL